MPATVNADCDTVMALPAKATRRGSLSRDRYHQHSMALVTSYLTTVCELQSWARRRRGGHGCRWMPHFKLSQEEIDALATYFIDVDLIRRAVLCR